MHIGHVKRGPVGRYSNVLRHASLAKPQIAQHLMVDEIDLDQTAATELAGKDRVAPVYREIGVVDAGAARGGDRLLQHHCVRIPEIEPLAALRYDNSRVAVRAKIEVEAIVDR